MNLKKFVLLPLAALVLASCGPNVVPPEGISVAAAETTLEMGDTMTLTATLTPADAEADITWSSSDTEVATVDATGTVTAVGLGEVEITATVVSDDIILRDSVTLAVNPDVEAVLASIATEIAVTGTASLVAPGGSLGSFAFDTYLNVNQGEMQLYWSSEGSVYSYFADEEGYLVDYVLNNHNEVQVISYTSGGQPVPAENYITYSFGAITASEVVVTTPTQLDVAIGEDHGAVDLAVELSGYICDVTDTVTINLNKDGSVASLTVVGHGVAELTGGSTTDYVNTVTATVTTKEAIGAPNKATPMPELTGDDAAIVNSFLTGLENENYTLDIVDTGESIGEVVVTDDGVIADGTVFALTTDGVYEVTVDEEAGTMTATSAEAIAAAVSELLNPVDFSPNLFIPQGNNVYKLAGGLTDNVLLGLDPALVFIGDYYLIPSINSVEITLTVEGATVTGATLSYTYDYYGLGWIMGDLVITITNIGTTAFPYADLEFVEYVPPTAWSDVTGDENWYQTATEALGEEVDNVPFIVADWYGYADTEDSEFGVQASFTSQTDAVNLVNSYLAILAAAGWTDSGLVDPYGSVAYTNGTSAIYVSTDAWSSGYDYITDIIFWSVDSLAPAVTQWSDLDAAWAEGINTTTGGDIDTVPFTDLGWQLMSGNYAIGGVTTDVYDASYNAYYLEYALTEAGWTQTGLIDPATENEVWTLEGNPIAVSVYLVTVTMTDGSTGYAVKVDFLAASSCVMPPAATSWSEYDADFAASMEAAGIDVDLVPFLDAEWACDASTSSAYVYTDPTTAQEIYDAFVALLEEAGWTAAGEADESGITTFTNPDTNVTIGVQLDVRTTSVAYVNLYWGTSAAE